ncbi:MAG TPA: hypothetical protein VF759_14095 [Allosphingosinicella sp.]|jgi:hypothetical protein
MAKRHPSVRSLIFAAAVLLAAFLIWRIVTRPEQPSLWLIIFAALLLAAVVIAAAALAFARHASKWTGFSGFAQGLASIVTIAALFIAAGIYFAERRDKPKLAVSVATNAIALPRSGRGARQLLLTIQVPVENRGAGRVDIECMSLGLSGLPEGAEPRRGGGSSEEIEFEAIGPPINYVAGEQCNSGEEKRKGLAAGTVRPLYRWPRLSLEPGEVDDRYFETVLSCRHVMARALVKLRIRAEDKYGYESKALIPLAAVCAGDKETATGISTPAQSEAPEKASPDSSDSNLQSPPVA